jgi:hypothetical protein
MNALLAEGLLSLFDRLLLRLRPNLNEAIDWIRDAATPPDHLEFKASDGAVYTGLVVLERSRAILMLAVRSGQFAPNPPLVTPHQTPSYQSSPCQARYESQPRTGDLFEDDDPGDGWNAHDPFLPRR